MEYEHANATTASDNYDETHNYCTMSKCFYNPKEKATSASTKLRCCANFCIGCGINMGDCNPRQYCYKIYCPVENMDAD